MMVLAAIMHTPRAEEAACQGQELERKSRENIWPGLCIPLEAKLCRISISGDIPVTHFDAIAKQSVQDIFDVCNDGLQFD